MSSRRRHGIVIRSGRLYLAVTDRRSRRENARAGIAEEDLSASDRIRWLESGSDPEALALSSDGGRIVILEGDGLWGIAVGR